MGRYHQTPPSQIRTLVKDVLRQIELAIITQQMNNTKLEILEWVDANVKV